MFTFSSCIAELVSTKCLGNPATTVLPTKAGVAVVLPHAVQSHAQSQWHRKGSPGLSRPRKGSKKKQMLDHFYWKNLVNPTVNPMVNPQPRAKVGIQHTWFGASSLKCWSSDNVHVGQINAATNEKSNLDPIEPYLPDI